jgi:hypothetical protein
MIRAKMRSATGTYLCRTSPNRSSGYQLDPPGMANFMIAEINQNYLVLLLYDLHALLVAQRVRDRFRPALVTGVGRDHAA